MSKVSPIVASASYLNYLRCAWEYAFPDAPLVQQTVVVTLPASFDDLARVMTRQACRLAGLPEVHLLEEPTAACYDWFRQVQSGDLSVPDRLSRILVCDIGGGTTDFSLLAVTQWEPTLHLQRIAVGEHLMLGGDNIDLALATQVEQSLAAEQNETTQRNRNGFNLAQLSQLMAQTRTAKEVLLSESAPESASVTLLGQGRGLMASAKTATLRRDQVRDVVLEGYFPHVDLDVPVVQDRGGLKAFGLPYARDAAVTRHLAAFLRKHGTTAGTDGSKSVILPDAVIMNGGLFNSPLLRQRIVDQLSHWTGQTVALLPNTDPNYSVARGAVAFGAALSGVSHKIVATLPRHYFLLPAGLTDQGICLLPKGSETAQRHYLGQQFALRVGEPVQMDVVASTHPRAFVVGEVAPLQDISPVPLPPLRVTVPPPSSNSPSACTESKQDACDAVIREVPVRLSASATDIGTLQLSCEPDPQSSEAIRWPTGQCWQFEFEVLEPTGRHIEHTIPESVNFPESHPKLTHARAAIRTVFGKASAKAASDLPPGKLRARLEKVLGPRDDWNVMTLRGIADELLACMKRRRRSDTHERVWCWLTGFCLRPGYGAPDDAERMAKIWSIFDAGLQYDSESQNQSQWWLLWRRVSGGLGAAEQICLVNAVESLLDRLQSSRRQQSAKARALLDAQAAGQADAIRLVGTLERLPLARREALGRRILGLLEADLNNESLWWSLGRLGARRRLSPVLSHAEACDADGVVLAPDCVAPWLCVVMEWLQGFKQSATKMSTKNLAVEAATFALFQMSQRVDEVALNINETLAEQVVAYLVEFKVPNRWCEAIQHVCSDDKQDEKRRVGEQMPYGIRLISR
ncbi:MAG: Hsp70 family protein [Gammaproteobacteria bacterium]